MSLSRRITVSLTATTLVASGVAFGWLYLKQSYVEGYLRQRALVQQAQEIANCISINDNGSIDLNLPARLQEAYSSPGGRYRYAIRDEAGRIVLTSGSSIRSLPQAMQGPYQSYEYGGEGSGNQLVGAAFRSTMGQRIFVTQVEQTVPRMKSLGAAVLNEFVTDGGWLGIPFLIALLGISAFIVKRSLAPLDELSAVAAKINPGSAELRLPHRGIPREILPLVSSINGALDRLDDGFRRQREFNANAAHQLRTPLAVLAASIDTMDDKVIAKKLRYDVELMSRIVSQLLLVARLETLNIRLDEQLELGSVTREAAEDLGPIAISMGKTLEVEAPPVPIFIRGNGPVVIAAVSNLIENALNHSPPGGAVRIRITSTPAIEVCDSGPGIAPEMREKIFERFWRGENSKEGAGLGLSIVEAGRIIFTSGTTGQPKGVRLSGRQVHASATALAEATDASAADRYLSVLPSALLLEQISGIYAPLSVGAQIHLPWESPGRSGNDSIAAAAQEAQVTVTVLVPELLAAWLRQLQAMDRSGPSSLRYVAVGGAPISRQLAAAAWEQGLPVHEGYGLSECCSVVSLNRPGDRRVGTVGRPLPGVRVTIDNGEIVVSGPTVMKGYLTASEADGTWCTGDLGNFDPDGFLIVTGRKDNILVTGEGRNIQPEWIEETIVEDRRIKRCVVVEYHSELVAVVTPDDAAQFVDPTAMQHLQMHRPVICPPMQGRDVTWRSRTKSFIDLIC